MKHRTALLKSIALASVLPCPEIAPARVAVRLSDGFEFSPYGSIPWPSRIETRGFVYCCKRTGTYYGKRFATERAAELAWRWRQLRNAVDFLRQLRAMDSADIARQAAFWLKSFPQD